MSLDAICLGALRAELEREITGMKVDKVQQPGKDRLVLGLRGNGKPKKLLISAGSGNARLHLTEETDENPASPPMLCMLLRKQLVGARLAALTQPETERVLDILFDAVDPMGFPCQRHLIFESMGKYANLILTDGEMCILACVHRLEGNFTESRMILPGLRYRLPPPQNKSNPAKVSPDFLREMLNGGGEKELSTVLMETFSGFSPLICRELAFRASGRTDVRVSEIIDGGLANTAVNVFLEFQRVLCSGDYTPYLLTDSTGAPKDFSFAAVFTYEENQDMPDGELTASDKDSLKRIMGDYAEATGHQFTFDPTGRKAYDMELATRFGDRTLDLLIVVKKYLTGANFRRCNTLFLDRALKSHELIQAFARTVRTEKETKDQGNIVCYQTTKQDVNDALVEYSNGDMANVHSLAKDYGELIADFMAAMAATKLTNPDSRSKEEQDEFVAAFGKAVHDFEKLSLYPEFDLDKGSVPGITLHDYNILKSKYKDIWDERHKPGQPVSIEDNVEFVINVLETDTIDYDYIFDLLKDITDTPDPSLKERIIRIIEGIADKSKAGLIKEFVDQTMSVKISEDDDVRDRFGRFIKEKQQKDVEAIASKYRIPVSRVAPIAFSFLRTDDVPTAKESVVSVIMETPPQPSNVRELTEKTDALTLEIASFRDKYKGFISFGA